MLKTFRRGARRSETRKKRNRVFFLPHNQNPIRLNGLYMQNVVKYGN